MPKKDKEDVSNLLDSLEQGLLKKLKNLQDEDSFEEWFDDLSPAAFTNMVNLLAKLRPIDVDAQREVLSLSESLKFLPDIEDIDRKSMIYRRELKRQIRNNRALRNLFEVETKVNKKWRNNKHILTGDELIQMTFDEFTGFLRSIWDWIKEVERIMEFRGSNNIPADLWRERIVEVAGKFHFNRTEAEVPCSAEDEFKKKVIEILEESEEDGQTEEVEARKAEDTSG